MVIFSLIYVEKCGMMMDRWTGDIFSRFPSLIFLFGIGLRKCLKPSLSGFPEQHFLKLRGVSILLNADPKQHSRFLDSGAQNLCGEK